MPVQPGEREYCMIKRRISFFLYYIISVAIVFALFGSLKWLDYIKLMANGTSTNAIVTTTACSSNMTFSYRFSVGDQSFIGSGGEGYGNKSCISLKPGDAAMIFYLDSDPNTNTPGDPGARFISEFAGIALVAFFVPLLLLLISFCVFRIGAARLGGSKNA